ncbi:MAG: hypothetical protein WDW36_003309 [Sanguina aurantia]
MPHNHHVKRRSKVVTAMLNYNFTTPEVQLRRGLTYLGSNWRLRRAVHKLLSEPAPELWVGVIGGSITQGHTVQHDEIWFTLLQDWLTAAAPHATLHFRNGAIGGCASPFFVLCMERSVDAQVDILFSEFLLNDGSDDGSISRNLVTWRFERVVRRSLGLDSKPAFVVMHVYPHAGATELSHNEHRPFHWGAEDTDGAVSQYYDIPSLSFRTASYRLAMFKHQPGFTFQELMIHDMIHPGVNGHRVMGELAIWLIQQTAIDLLSRPYSTADEEQAAEPMPDPMMAGNEVPTTPLCFATDLFTPLVVSSHGFLYTDEGSPGNPKKGYVATAVGAELRFNVSTSRDGVPGSKVSVHVSYLASYQHMGVASITCVSGCECEPTELDAHITELVSQTYLHPLLATQSEDCLVSVMVVERTSSGEHKVKINGVVMSERTEEEAKSRRPDDRFDLEGAFRNQKTL